MKIKNNKYRQTYLDLTSKCNTNCIWCSNTKYSMEDITLNKVKEVCAGFRNRVEMRLLGGEPTIHPEIFEIIKIVKKYGHIPTIISNGIKFSNKEFCRKIKENGYVLVSLSMDADVNGLTQFRAINNLIESGYKRFALTATLTGYNNVIIDRIKWIQESVPEVKYVHFRSLIQGPDSLTLKRLEKIISIYWPEWNNPYNVIRDGKTFAKCQHCQQCVLKAITPNLHILLLDDYRSNNCFLRGYIDPINMVVNPFFETIRERL